MGLLRLFGCLLLLEGTLSLPLTDHHEAMVEVVEDGQPEGSAAGEKSLKNDPKAMKLLPILARLQAKYKNLSLDDKKKLTERAEEFQKKFKSVIDRIDSSIAKEYNLDLPTIRQILSVPQPSSDEIKSRGAAPASGPTASSTSTQYLKPIPVEINSAHHYPPIEEEHHEVPFHHKQLKPTPPVYIPDEDKIYQVWRDQMKYEKATGRAPYQEEHYDEFVPILPDRPPPVVYIPNEDKPYQQLRDQMKIQKQPSAVENILNSLINRIERKTPESDLTSRLQAFIGSLQSPSASASYPTQRFPASYPTPPAPASYPSPGLPGPTRTNAALLQLSALLGVK